MDARCSAVFAGAPLTSLDQLSESLCVGVVFFPSLPFMGVILFPSFWLGNAFGGGGASFALLSLFFFLSSSSSFLPLLPSFLFSLLSSSTSFSSASLFLLSPLSLPPLFSFLPITLPFLFFSPYHTPFFFGVFFSFCLSPLSSFFSFFFFLRGFLVLNVYQDVIEDTTYCNRMRFI